MKTIKTAWQWLIEKERFCQYTDKRGTLDIEKPKLALQFMFTYGMFRKERWTIEQMRNNAVLEIDHSLRLYNNSWNRFKEKPDIIALIRLQPTRGNDGWIHIISVPALCETCEHQNFKWENYFATFSQAIGYLDIPF